MKKLISIIAIVLFMWIGLPVLGYLLKWLLPDTAIGEVILGISSMMWPIFKQFELGDLLQSAGLYIVITVVIAGLGFTISRNTENRIWLIVSIVVSLFAILTMN